MAARSCHMPTVGHHIMSQTRPVQILQGLTQLNMIVFILLGFIVMVSPSLVLKLAAPSLCCHDTQEPMEEQGWEQT